MSYLDDVTHKDWSRFKKVDKSKTKFAAKYAEMVNEVIPGDKFQTLMKDLSSEMEGIREEIKEGLTRERMIQIPPPLFEEGSPAKAAYDGDVLGGNEKAEQAAAGRGENEHVS